MDSTQSPLQIYVFKGVGLAISVYGSNGYVCIGDGVAIALVYIGVYGCICIGGGMAIIL